MLMGYAQCCVESIQEDHCIFPNFCNSLLSGVCEDSENRFVDSELIFLNSNLCTINKVTTFSLLNWLHMV